MARQLQPANKIYLVGNLEKIDGKVGAAANSGPVNPFKFLALLDSPETQVQRWSSASLTDNQGKKVNIYYALLTPGNKVMRPGLKFKVEGTFFERLDFASLMLALFCGTAALPHILIRYYTVRDRAAVRKSTIVAIAVIGFFYILTLFMGLGAMTSAVVNPLDNNMSAPLLARSFSEFLFAVISAIAFATVLGTVSGLIIAASGAVAHDLLDRYAQIKMSETVKVRAGKIAAVGVGVIAIILGYYLSGHECIIPGWFGVCGCGIGKPACDHYDPVLEKNHCKRHNSINHSGHRSCYWAHPAFTRNVWTLWSQSRISAGAFQQPGHHFYPAQFHHPGCGFFAHQKENAN